MHRRPTGPNTITGQNNGGCHGWWTLEHLDTRPNRMGALCRPRTCQLAEKSHVMKHQILKMF